ncbi:MAG TPA: hypothetical protein VFG83_13520, partial [Kofleriaceae bacterium]|nr:hypothetical protein [Kofleriaceae bacterium]
MMPTALRTSLLLLVFGSAGLAGWSGTALAFPLSDGADANHVVGQADFDTGFVDFELDPFFGAQPTSSSRFFVTSDVAYDTANQRLFVADLHNHRFLMFELGAGITGDIAASLVLGQPDFVTGGTDPADPFGHFNTQNAAFGCTTEVNACGVHRAWGVAFSQGLLFGTDPDNNRVLVWDLASPANGMAATYVLGQPDFSTNAPNS